jgi:hypothetical protein
MTVEQILELLRSTRDEYNHPDRYADEEYSFKCQGIVDILGDVIDVIEYRISNGE